MEEFRSLPEDNFGVHVENEKDERKLLWLANEIGEKKLRASAMKRNKYYPDDKLFVSVILKRFHLKVPPRVYTAVRVPMYHVYLLYMADRSAVKVGFTSDWPGRSLYIVNPDISPNEAFDLDRSRAFFVESERKARDLEAALKKLFSDRRIDPPLDRGLIWRGASGRKEWFDVSIYETALIFISESLPLSTERGRALRDALLDVTRLADGNGPSVSQ